MIKKTDYLFHNFICVLLVTILPACLHAATYYIDSTEGSDTVDGISTTSAWKSLNKLNQDIFTPGDTILLKRGGIWHESVVFQSSGTPDHPITIGTYGNPNKAKPLIDGTSPTALHREAVSTSSHLFRVALPSTTAPPGLIFYNGAPKPPIATLQFASSVNRVIVGAILLQTDGYYCNMQVTSVDSAHNRISGITLFRNPKFHWRAQENVEVRQLDEHGRETQFHLTLAQPGGLLVDSQNLTQPGHWYWNPDDSSIYLYSDVAPENLDIEVGEKKTGISISNHQNIIIRDLSIRGFNEVGVLLQQAESISLNNLSVSGIGVQGHKTGILLNESSNCTVTKSTIDSSLVTGIGIYAFARNSWYNTISANLVRHTGSAGILLNTDKHENAGMVKDNLITGNTVEHANQLAYDSAGIYALNIGTGNVIRENTITNGGNEYLRSAGIMIDDGVLPVSLIANKAENNSLAGIAITGSGHVIEANVLHNNGVSSWESAQLLFFPVSENVSTCSVQNNKFYADGDTKLILKIKNSGQDDPSNQFDHNEYQSSNPQAFCWSDTDSCNGWVDFDTWKRLTQQDTHSRYSTLPGNQFHRLTAPLALLLHSQGETL